MNDGVLIFILYSDYGDNAHIKNIQNQYELFTYYQWTDKSHAQRSFVLDSLNQIASAKCAPKSMKAHVEISLIKSMNNAW